MNHNCYFCPEKIFSLNKEIDLPGKESIIYEDDNVFIIPDIAPLVVGHFVIVAKQHINSFGGSSDVVYTSLERAKDYLIHSVFHESDFIFLEHGSVIENSGGSSIDHAHIHGMPLDRQICVEDYIRKCGFITSCKVACSRKTLMSYFSVKQPYIYYEFRDRQGWAYSVETLPHQFFRMMIGDFFSVDYNWKEKYKDRESKAIFNMTLNSAKKCSLTNLEVKE